MDDNLKCFKLVDNDDESVVMTSHYNVETSQSDVAIERTNNVDNETTPTTTSNRKRRRRKRQIMLVTILLTVLNNCLKK
jgi:hypothetical protein